MYVKNPGISLSQNVVTFRNNLGGGELADGVTRAGTVINKNAKTNSDAAKQANCQNEIPKAVGVPQKLSKRNAS
jgi:hypothetical protein